MAELQKTCLKAELLFVDRPWAADPVRIDAALQFHERPHMFSIMQIKMEHVPFIKIAIHKWLLAPVVVPDLPPNLASFASHRQEPIIPTRAQTNVFDGVPELLPLGRIGKKAPIVVHPKQLINPCGGRGFGRRNRLALQEQRARKKHDHQDRGGSHLSLRSTCMGRFLRPVSSTLACCSISLRRNESQRYILPE